RKKRRKAEMEEKRRKGGDSHWSKILQVSTETNGLRHKRCIRMCRSFSLKEPTGCRLGLSLNRGGSTSSSRSHRGRETGIIANIAARIRQWLQSKRRYEVSPASEAADGTDRSDGEGAAASLNGRGLRTEDIKEDYLIISHVNNYHPELKRAEGYLSRSCALGTSKSATAIAASDREGSSTSPTSRHLERPSHNVICHKRPVVNINIEFADQVMPVEPRSYFAANPLKLNQNHTPKTAIMTPFTRALSRSQQLRQSRNKYMKLLQKTGQL
ncbi:unnamed protein product, partial [Candidula unifasciata]